MECRRSVGERLEGTHEQIRQVHVLPAAGGLQQDSSLAATNAICCDTLCSFEVQFLAARIGYAYAHVEAAHVLEFINQGSGL